MTLWEGPNILKLYSVEVCFYQTCKFVILGENIRQARTQTSFKNIYFPIG